MKLPFAAQIVFVVFSIANGKSASYFTTAMEGRKISVLRVKQELRT